MLRRLAQLGVVTDAATSDDFRRVRALPGWPELEAVLKNGSTQPAAEAADRAAPAETPVASPPPRPLKAGADPPAVEAAPKTALEEEPLPTTLASVEPAGLAYDAVSRRFIIGNRSENNLIVYDDVFKRATNMVGADSAGFYGLTAMEIDALRGDLWIANSSAARGATIHKLQLV
jgi:hypothetical protein